MADHIFNPIEFRARFSNYSDNTEYPDNILAGNWNIATIYITDRDEMFFGGEEKQEALNLVTAHITFINDSVSMGRGGKIIKSISNDMQRSEYVPFPTTDAFSHWLGQSPYGQQLLALLEAISRGGLYVGGSPQTSAFRNLSGGFGK